MNIKPPSYKSHRFPSQIISHAGWVYHRFCLSFREVEELLAERGLTVTYETIRQGCQKFGVAYARKLKKRQGRLGDTWHPADVFVSIQGERQYLWRAVNQDGDTIDILVQRRRNKQAAVRFFRRLLKGQGREPRWMITDTLKSYGAAHQAVMPTVEHINAVYANNRVEVSHQPTRQQEYHIARVFFSNSSSTVFDVTRTHLESLSSRPPPHAGGQLPSVAYSGLSGLERCGVCMRWCHRSANVSHFICSTLS